MKDDYRVGADGVAELGRLLIEDLNDEGEPAGLVRIYFYKPLTDENLSSYSGLETNPATGRPYAVGDVVERFASSAKGVIATDYVETPDWWLGKYLQGDVAAELRKFHTWTLRANIDVTDPSDLGQWEKAERWFRRAEEASADGSDLGGVNGPRILRALSEGRSGDAAALFRVTQ